MASKTAFDASRISAFGFDPEDLVLIDDPKHPLYDARIKLPLSSQPSSRASPRRSSRRPRKQRNQKPRRKGPIQLCPVPGCKGRAAPVFGMVRAAHKSVPKAKIKAYREARRAKKAKRG
jgi:hypothetical protein